MRTLVKNIDKHGLVLFLGAGTSMIPPSSLPSWYQFNDLILEALTKRVADYTGHESYAKEVLATLTSRRDTTEFFCPDYQAQLIEEECGEDYFRVLQALNTNEFNSIHAGITELARGNKLTAIVTTNFDRLIERALLAAGVGFQVYFDTAGFESLAESLNKPAAPLTVVKVHGSVESPASMVDTLRQRLAKRPEALENALITLLQRHYWLFMGFSGSDLNYDPNYLGFRDGADTAVGFTFLVRTGTSPREAVLELIESYHPKADIVQGELPPWFDELLETLGVMLPERPSELQQVNHLPKLRQRVESWVDSLGDISVVNILAALLRSSGRENIAFHLLRRTWSFYRDPKDCSGSAYGRYNYNYGKALMEAGSVHNPVSFEEDPVEWKHYADRNAFEFLARAAKETNLPEAYIDLAVVQAYRGESRNAREGFRRIWDWAYETRSGLALIDAAIAAGTIYDILGEYTYALNLLEIGYSVAVTFGDEPRRAKIIAHLTRFLGYKKQFTEAEERLAEGVKITKRLNLAPTAASIQAAQGSVLIDKNDPEAAMPSLVAAAQWFEKAERLPELVRVLLDLVWAAYYAGSKSTLNDAIDRLDIMAHDVVFGYMPHYYLRLAQIYVENGDLEEGKSILTIARKQGQLAENEWVALEADRIEQLMTNES